MPTAYSYIRFSTPDQLRGGSLTRQGDAAAMWAERHGYDLDDSHMDLGKSAFSGAHRKGALGAFLSALERKEIAPESAFVIESLDRLSREDVLDAMGLLSDIIKSGVKVITLSDGLEFTRDTLRSQPSLFYILIGKMQGANEFSRTNSRRVFDGKNKARQKAIEAKQPSTSMCPAWLRVEKDEAGVRRFVEIEERVEILRQIFHDLDNDVSKALVVRKLNEAGTATFDRAGQGLKAKPGSKRGWHVSYIGKLVKNRALLGEFQPTTKRIESGKVVAPAGIVIMDHYPEIISRDVFDRVNGMVKPVGRRGFGFANLFSGMTRCMSCHSPMHYLNKGERRPVVQERRKESRAKQYLVCDAAHRRLTADGKRICEDSKAVPYHLAEQHLIATAGFLTRAEEFVKDDAASAIEVRLADLKAQVANIEKYVERTLEVMSDDPAPMVAKIIKRKQAEADTLNEEIRKLATRALQARNADTKRDYTELRRLTEKADSTEDIAERYKLRAKLHGILTRTIDIIEMNAGRQEMNLWMRRGHVLVKLDRSGRLALTVSGERSVVFRDDGSETPIPTPPGVLAQHREICESYAKLRPIDFTKL